MVQLHFCIELISTQRTLCCLAFCITCTVHWWQLAYDFPFVSVVSLPLHHCSALYDCIVLHQCVLYVHWNRAVSLLVPLCLTPLTFHSCSCAHLWPLNSSSLAPSWILLRPEKVRNPIWKSGSHAEADWIENVTPAWLVWDWKAAKWCLFSMVF